MRTAWLAGVMSRELRTLLRELDAYPTDAALWAVPPGVSNSGGTLMLHLAGNLNHFIGTVLGGSGFRRDRDAEFGSRDLPRAELKRQLESALETVARVLPGIDDGRLDQPFPGVPGGLSATMGDFLLHLATHLAFHTGQVDYHRRLMAGAGAASVGPQAIGELATAAKA
jgi:uncharacterized damage-inducible protein DinB